MIDFHYAPTPNGWKVAIMLEECGLDYDLKPVRLHEGDQFAPDFLAISPNAKMPAILDHAPAAGYGDAPLPIFESAAILLYLAEKTGRFAPPEGDRRACKELMEWLFWQTGSQGPMGGQLSHYRNYAPEAERDYGFRRYLGEYERTMAVLENRLRDRPHILGEAYSIADMQAFPWAFIAKPLGSSLDRFPNVADWRERLKSRPAVRRAIDLQKDRQNRGEGKRTVENDAVTFNQNADRLLALGRGGT
ncbi:glutathione S-transferase C-terminal domain-containing protein [uncultured Jannaschia sp.]|uniref:glutathione S-transferase C-terminal domain-containing protein n=1 Tax=uncultured Jannaschia sp. TaxID=293347 RepID=UPI00262837D3|nr:glutathione S-transferase C-terminal domain-containing protein [uncultured Jannaschia sp.]